MHIEEIGFDEFVCFTSYMYNAMYVHASSGDSNVHIERAITTALDAGCHNTK